MISDTQTKIQQSTLNEIEGDFQNTFSVDSGSARNLIRALGLFETKEDVFGDSDYVRQPEISVTKLNEEEGWIYPIGEVKCLKAYSKPEEKLQETGSSYRLLLPDNCISISYKGTQHINDRCVEEGIPSSCAIVRLGDTKYAFWRFDEDIPESEKRALLKDLTRQLGVNYISYSVPLTGTWQWQTKTLQDLKCGCGVRKNVEYEESCEKCEQETECFNEHQIITNPHPEQVELVYVMFDRIMDYSKFRKAVQTEGQYKLAQRAKRQAELDELFNSEILRGDDLKRMRELREDGNWIVEGLVRYSSLIELYGASEIGKSTFARYIVYCIVTGKPCLGRATKQAQTAWLTSDESYEDYEEQIGVYGLEDNPNFVVVPRFQLDQIERVDELFKQGVKVLVIDSYTTCSLNSTTSITQVEHGKQVTRIKLLAEIYGACVILLHHTNRSGQYLGHVGQVIQATAFWRYDELASLKPNQRRLSFEKFRGQRGKEALVLTMQEGFEFTEGVSTTAEKAEKGKLNDRQAEILNWATDLNDDFTIKQLREDSRFASFSKRTLERDLAYIVDHSYLGTEKPERENESYLFFVN